MLTKKQLKEKYSQLDRREKEVIGAALVKVNLGLALPMDLKRVAVFLKGSPYIAKAGELEELIYDLHDDEPEKQKIGCDVLHPPLEKPSPKDDPMSNDLYETMFEYDEDHVTTAKESLKGIKKRSENKN